MDLRLFTKPTAPVGRRLGVAVVTANDLATARGLAQAAAAQVTVSA